MSATQRLVAGLTVLLVIVAYAVLVPAFAGVDERVTDFSAAHTAPSIHTWFGTDSAGRDLFVRVAAGLRVSLVVALVSALAATLLGSLLGIVSAVAGGRTDRVLMRCVDTVNSVPHLLLGVVIVALYRGNVWAIIISIAVTHWTQVTRIVRSEALSLRGREFVDAAITGGASRWRVTRRHLLPAVVPQAVLSGVLMVPHAIWHESTLSFLGLGLPAHQASLGTLLEDARASVLLGSWWTLVFPALALVACTFSVALVGGVVRDKSIPQRRSGAGL